MTKLSLGIAGSCLALVAAFSLASCGGSGGDDALPEDELGQFGSELNVAEFEASPDVLPLAAVNRTRDPIPPAVMLSNLPSIATQGTPPKPLGSPGSCEAQSFAYGLGSYTAARNSDGTVKWDASLPQNQISAAYQYRFQHSLQGKTCPSGSLAIPYLNRLIAVGSPSAQDIPYIANCDYLDGISLNPAFPNVDRFRIGSFAAMNIAAAPDSVLQTIKEYLAQGHAVAFSGLVLQGYSAPVMRNGVIYSTATVPNSGHGQLIVGYDDNIGDPDNPGALLIQNSFGPQWPPASSGSAAPPGMAYWSYNTFKSTQALAAVAFSRAAQPPQGEPLNANVALMPQGILEGAIQSAQSTSGPVYLILSLWFSDPVKINSLTLIEPGTGTKLTTSYGYNVSNGTVHFVRNDGSQFAAGVYGLTIAAESLNGTAVTYSGSVALDGASPASPPPSLITGNSAITDTIGEPAVIQ